MSRKNNERILFRRLQKMAQYINYVVEANNKHYEAINVLCRRNNVDKANLTKSEEVIEYEKKLKTTYEKVKSLYDDLVLIRHYNSSGMDIVSDVRNFNNQLSLMKFPIFTGEKLKLVRKTELQETPADKGISTGAAAEILDKISQDMTNNIEFPTIAGVEKKEPMTFEQAGGGKVNPHYDKGGGYHRNCQVCVAVFEARMRGYDIEAKPLDENNEVMMKLRRRPEKVFIDSETGKSPKRIKMKGELIIGEMLKWLDSNIKPEGIYGMIFVHETYKNSGELVDHIIIVYKTKQNELKFYDPQNNKDLGLYQLKELIVFKSQANNKAPIIEHSPIIFRIDNADLNIEYLNQISMPVTY